MELPTMGRSTWWAHNVRHQLDAIQAGDASVERCAIRRVFGIAELRDKILHLLDDRSLVVMKDVNQTFRAHIQGSRRLMTLAFLSHHPDMRVLKDHPRALMSAATINPRLVGEPAYGFLGVRQVHIGSQRRDRLRISLNLELGATDPHELRIIFPASSKRSIEEFRFDFSAPEMQQYLVYPNPGYPPRNTNVIVVCQFNEAHVLRASVLVAPCPSGGQLKVAEEMLHQSVRKDWPKRIKVPSQVPSLPLVAENGGEEYFWSKSAGRLIRSGVRWRMREGWLLENGRIVDLQHNATP